MKPQDVEHGEYLSLIMAADPAYDVARLAGSEVLLSTDVAMRRYVLRSAHGSVPAWPVNDQVREALEVALTRPHIATVTSSANRDSVHIEVRMFRTSAEAPPSLLIRVNQATAHRLMDKAQVSADHLVAGLAEALTIEAAPGRAGSRMVIHVGSGKRQESAFRVLGKRCWLDVQSSGSGDFVGHRASTTGRSTRSDAALIEGLIEFEIGEPRDETRVRLDELVKSDTGFVNLWNQYRMIEHDFKIRRAREKGRLSYRRFERSPSGYIFDVDRDQLTVFAPQADDRLIAIEPGTMIDWMEEEPQDFDTRDPEGPTLQVIKADRGSLVCRLAYSDEERSVPGHGELCLSLAGDRTLDDRRSQALDRISTGRSGMPGLRLVLDDAAFAQKRRGRVTRIPPDVERYFPMGMTPRQREAIQIALDTPDIALVQGPPGTGKTQVISAILDIVAQELRDQPAGHRVLLTGEQHEAVRNAVERYQQDTGTEPFLISTDEADLDSAERRIRERAKSIRQRVAVLSPRLVDLVEIEQVAEDSRAEQPLSAGECLAWCDRLAVHADQLGEGLPVQVRELRAEAQSATEARMFSDESPQMRAARMLPSPLESLLDGGLLVIHGWCIDRLRPSLDGSQIDALEGVTRQRLAADGPAVAAELAALRAELIEQWSTSGLLEARDFRVDLQRLARAILASAVRQWSSRDDEPLREALRLARTLEDDPEGGIRSVTGMSGIVASTNARAFRKEMQELQASGTDDLWFDTVVIDEAAHANPLDLMIPMSLARRRIILVGDHRQLPQMLEPGVEEALRAGDQAATVKLGSLFEHMITLVDHEEARTGIRRRVTLDMQFRMPKPMGDFLSRNFYAADGGVETGIGPLEHVHQDPQFEGSCYGWWDARTGSESGGRSKYRNSEARAVAALIRRWVDLGTAPTIGAIAMYKRQVLEILKELVPVGLAERDDSGRLTLTPFAEERVKINTVDAFQGRQFDLVALSLVRSNSLASQRARFGFLSLPNRLCVAMSRQKELLVVVGDHQMFSTTEAHETVPALAEFARMSQAAGYVRA